MIPPLSWFGGFSQGFIGGLPCSHPCNERSLKGWFQMGHLSTEYLDVENNVYGYSIIAPIKW